MNSLEGSPGLLVPQEMAGVSDLDSSSASWSGADLAVATWVGVAEWRFSGESKFEGFTITSSWLELEEPTSSTTWFSVLESCRSSSQSSCSVISSRDGGS